MPPPDNIWTALVTAVAGLFGVVVIPMYGLYRLGHGDRDAATVAITTGMCSLLGVALLRDSPSLFWVASAAGGVAFYWGKRRAQKEAEAREGYERRARETKERQEREERARRRQERARRRTEQLWAEWESDSPPEIV